jgi:hypothetical protein
VTTDERKASIDHQQFRDAMSGALLRAFQCHLGLPEIDRIDAPTERADMWQPSAHDWMNLSLALLLKYERGSLPEAPQPPLERSKDTKADLKDLRDRMIHAYLFGVPHRQMSDAGEEIWSAIYPPAARGRRITTVSEAAQLAYRDLRKMEDARTIAPSKFSAAGLAREFTRRRAALRKSIAATMEHERAQRLAEVVELLNQLRAKGACGSEEQMTLEARCAEFQLKILDLNRPVDPKADVPLWMLEPGHVSEDLRERLRKIDYAHVMHDVAANLCRLRSV